MHFIQFSPNQFCPKRSGEVAPHPSMHRRLLLVGVPLLGRGGAQSTSPPYVTQYLLDRLLRRVSFAFCVKICVFFFDCLLFVVCRHFLSVPEIFAAFWVGFFGFFWFTKC
jgi:hypothetical protein